MAYTVKKLANLAGISVRTLHFYDAIGLLRPARVNDKGYRFYENEQLLRLQQILVYREMGMPLVEIQTVMMGDDFDVLVALESHRNVVRKQLQEKASLLTTIEKTIAHIRGEQEMKDEELFKGFDPAKQEEYEREIIARYGPEAAKSVAESKRRTKGWTKSDYDEVKEEYHQIHIAFTQALTKGLKVDSEEVTALTRRHFLSVSRFYAPTKQMYAGLGQLYLDHPDFRKLYDSYHPDLAGYLAKAMQIFAEQHISD